MSGPFGSDSWMYSSGGYEIGQSLRFNDNDSAYLSRTPASAGNRKTWTWSGWVKLTYTHANNMMLFGCRQNASPYTQFQMSNTGTINFYDNGGATFVTNNVFRDVSAWYHIVLAIDTTQATDTERWKLYINGDQVTSFSTETYPSQNTDMNINTASSHDIGRLGFDNSSFFDGYMADVHFIDGQALDASYFGETDADYGHWKPIKYTGTYGTNGFYLDFNSYGALGATNSGTTIVNDTERGDVASFDGVNDYIQTPFADNFTDFTVSTFFKWESGSGNTSGELISKRSYYAASYTDFPFAIYVDNATGVLAAAYSTGNDYSFDLVQTTSALTSDTWYHVAVTYDRDGNSILYLDGTAIDTDASVSINANSLNWKLGQAALPYSSGVGDSEFKGRMSQFRMYDRALSSSEVTSLYNESGEPEDGLVAHYTLDEFLDGFGDQSGNSNDWTSNNLAATDVVLDSPTNNFATLNPLFNTSTLILKEGNLHTESSSGAGGSAGTFNVSSGKWYFEACYTYGVSSYPEIGIINGDASFTDLGHTTNTGSVLYRPDGKIYKNTGSGFVVDQTVSTASTGDVIGVAFDLDNQECSFYVNNTQVGTTVDTSYMSDDVIVRLGFGYHVARLVANFGQDSSFAGTKTAQGNTDANGIGDFYYAPPSGYLALCTQNLPEPTVAPADHFNTLIWSGAGNGNRSFTGVGFQPDLVWTKIRSQTYAYLLYDALRGTGNAAELMSNNADLEGGGNNESYDYLSSFDADGFSSTWSGSNFEAYFNKSGESYVAWNWKANGSGVSNTDGTITSTVSANTDAGFSILTATIGATAQSIGHGLSQEPELIIVKARNDALGWLVYHKDVGNNKYLILNTTAAEASYTGIFASQNSTTFTTLYSTLGNRDCVAYCFHSVDGFSKIGSYTGNGSTDGPFVYTGFRPAFVMIKRTDNVGSWWLFDAARNTYNVLDDYLFADLSSSEQSYDSLDFLSNGFKLKVATYQPNSSGGTFIYIAFAEHPFKYANAR